MSNKSGKIGKWISPQILNGWSTYGAEQYANPQYMIDELGMVHIRGIASSPSAPDYNTTPMFTLPPIYTPDYTLMIQQHNLLLSTYCFLVVCGGNTTDGQSTSGVDYVPGNIVISLKGSPASTAVAMHAMFNVGKERLRLL